MRHCGKRVDGNQPTGAIKLSLKLTVKFERQVLSETWNR
jgi:hypothetical protein